MRESSPCGFSGSTSGAAERLQAALLSRLEGNAPAGGRLPPAGVVPIVQLRAPEGASDGSIQTPHSPSDSTAVSWAMLQVRKAWRALRRGDGATWFAS